MITTTHARPQLHAAFGGVNLIKAILCPFCYKTVGASHDAGHTQRLLSTHRCAVGAPDMLQPSTAVPFS